MAVTLHWLVQDRIIYSHFSGIVTLSDMEEIVTKSIELVNSVNPAIPILHGVIDNRDVTEFPQSSYKVNRVLNDLLRHQRLGWLIYVTDANPLLKMLSTIVAQLAGTHYRFVENMQDAIEFLQYTDPTLPDISELDWSRLPVIHEISPSDSV